MGVDARLETGINRGGFGAFYSRSHLSHFRRGWTAHGDHLRHLLCAFSGAGRFAGDLWSIVDSIDLVLRGFNRLAGLSDPRDCDADGGDYRLGLETAKRFDQLAVCCGVSD